MSDLQHAIETLREFNLWRRADEDMDQPDPREIGQAIDAAIEELEELNEWKTLKSWGGTPEIINDFIKGQQSRVNEASLKQEEDLFKARAEIEKLNREVSGWMASAKQWEENAKELHEQRDTTRRLYDAAVEIAAKMHAAAVGENDKPNLVNPVQDILDLRRELAAVTEQRDEYKGLLIELHNDINTIHSGNAISKLNRMFKEENYN
jgi:hypothetical protein